MPVFEYGGLKIRLSDSGYLVNFDDWNETVACVLARKCVSEEFISPLLAWKLAGLPEQDELIVNLLEYGQSPG